MGAFGALARRGIFGEMAKQAAEENDAPMSTGAHALAGAGIGGALGAGRAYYGVRTPELLAASNNRMVHNYADYLVRNNHANETVVGNNRRLTGVKPLDAGTIKNLRETGRFPHVMGGAIVGAGAGLLGGALVGYLRQPSDKQANYEEPYMMEEPAPPSLLQRAGRVLATGVGGALGHAAGTYGLGAAASRGWLSSPSLAYVVPAAASAAGAGLANYAAGGTGREAVFSGLGAGAASAAGLRYHQSPRPERPADSHMTNGYPDPTIAGPEPRYIPAHHHWGSSAGVGGALSSGLAQTF